MYHIYKTYNFLSWVLGKGCRKLSISMLRNERLLIDMIRGGAQICQKDAKGSVFFLHNYTIIVIERERFSL